jgi:hypothetical protein
MAKQDRETTKLLGIDDIISDVTDEWADAPYESGFTWNTVLAALFIGFFMLPGLIYMGLAVGSDIGSGAEWVTVLLFLEIARRGYRKLKRQELFITMHMAASLTSMMGGVMLGGGLFAHLLWKQYLRSSEVYRNFNLTDKMPDWFAPSFEMLQDRTFIHEAWMPAIAVGFLTMALSRMQFFGLGYIIFRLTADVERLPFPLARIGAEGATALAESERKEKESWRWSVFSTLAILGVVWGFLYMGIPTLSSVLFGTPTHLIPIPFLDLTPYTEQIFPSSAWAVGFNLGLVLVAFVLPWRVVVGGAVTCILCQAILPPILFKLNIHRQWQPGFSALDTQIANGLDIWMSVGIGGALSLAATGIWLAVRGALKGRKEGKEKTGFDWHALLHPPEGRGDWPLWLAGLLAIVAGCGYVILCHGLVNLGWLGGFEKPRDEWFPIWILLAFAFLWTPINSYIHARLAGIAGQSVSIPYLREGSFILSGYRHPDIWVAPIPLHDLGGVSTLFKQLELTRVKFYSLVKVEIMTLLLLSLGGFFYWSYLWSMGSVPSASFPYAQEIWPFLAKNSALWTSALSEGNNQMLNAIKLPYIAGSAVFFTLVFAGLSLAGIPLAYYYGAVGGVGQFPYVAITMLFGLALRFLAARKLGKENLTRYAPVMMAGFAAGFGIAGMLVVAVVLVKSAISALPY